ncbi:hypothetical protein [Kutzneria kofuensis]|uniref:hypothetical protein n=1 Tax=Kutzneria kofuensis TaxID=103725 RepID=UPI0031ED742D
MVNDEHDQPPATFTSNLVGKNTTITTNYTQEHAPQLIDSAFAQFHDEIGRAHDDFDRLRAIGRVVRTLHVLHPFEDANGRLNVYLLLPKLLLQHGFEPAIRPEMSELFNGGYSVDQIASALHDSHPRANDPVLANEQWRHNPADTAPWFEPNRPMTPDQWEHLRRDDLLDSVHTEKHRRARPAQATSPARPGSSTPTPAWCATTCGVSRWSRAGSCGSTRSSCTWSAAPARPTRTWTPPGRRRPTACGTC